MQGGPWKNLPNASTFFELGILQVLTAPLTSSIAGCLPLNQRGPADIIFPSVLCLECRERVEARSVTKYAYRHLADTPRHLTGLSFLLRLGVFKRRSVRVQSGELEERGITSQ
jgi:hypothetical protein